MNSKLSCYLVCFLIHSVFSEFSQSGQNDFGYKDTKTTRSKNDERYADKNAEKTLHVNVKDDRIGYNMVQHNGSGLGTSMKQIINELIGPYVHPWNSDHHKEDNLKDLNEKLEQIEKLRDEGNGMQKSFELEKKRQQKKSYDKINGKAVEKNSQQNINEKDKPKTNENKVFHIVSEKTFPSNEMRKNDISSPIEIKSKEIPNGKVKYEQIVSGDVKIKEIPLQGRTMSELENEPNLLKNKEYDDNENLIADDYNETNMKRLKKNLWLENMIPKSNKFLYNNQRYHDHLPDHSQPKKSVQWETPESKVPHNRLKRSTLQSIFVQMPNEEEEAENVEDIFVNNEESRDKKSKGSTTVCLEIKSDPTKPPSTICGPEIKPNAPLDPQLYGFGSNYAVPNSFYYSEPQSEKVIWSLNPLHDPIYYSSLNNYKYQSNNREDQNHHAQKQNPNNRQGLEKHNLKSSQVSSSDNNYQTNKISMTQNSLSHGDKSRTLNPMPVANYNMDQDNYGTRGETSRNALSSSNVNSKDSDTLGVSKNFKDLDLNLDAEMSSNTNNFVDPNLYPQNQYDQNLNSKNSFSTGQTIFFPFSNDEANKGMFKSGEQAAEESSFYGGDQRPMSNEPLVGIKSEDEMKQPVPEEYSGSEPKSISNIGGPREDVNLRDSTNNPDQTMIAEGSSRMSAYDFMPYRDYYQYNGPGYPYMSSRPYQYRPYDYSSYGSYYNRDPYDPFCRSGKCRSAEPTTGSNSEILQMSPVNAQLQLVDPRSSEIFAMDAISQFGSRANDAEQFRGNAYYSGRPYPYRPSYEYQNSHRYPYSSRPYPYRPSGYTYPYEPDCRTADGRSCRDSEAERSSNDVNVAPSVPMQNYIRPHFPTSSPKGGNGGDKVQVNGNYRSMDLDILPISRAGVPDSSSTLQFQSRSAIDSANLQGTPESEILASPLHFKTTVPVAPNIMPVHAPVGLACNVVHAPVVPPQPIIKKEGLSSGIGIGAGHGHLGGGLSSGLGLNTPFSGLGTHSFHGLSLSGGHGVSSGGLSYGLGGVLSGVGSHGIGGSHGVAQHHILRESYSAEQNELIENEREHKERNAGPKQTAVIKANPAAKVEELKSTIKEKLKAAEEKLQSSKSAILEKINSNIVKEKKVKGDDNEDTIEDDGNEEVAGEPQSRSTFSSPAIVQFPTGGKITYSSGLPNIIPMMLGNGFLGAGQSGGSPFHINTPLGGSLTYSSPFFGTGPAGVGYAQSGVGFGQSGIGTMYPAYYASPYSSADLSNCDCSPGASTCKCPVNSIRSSLTENGDSFHTPAAINFDRSIAAPLRIEQNSYLSPNSPILGASPIGEPIVFNTQLSESSTSLESDTKSANVPCVRNSGNEILGSAINTNAQIQGQPIVSPISMSVNDLQSYLSPVEVSLRTPFLGSVQYNHDLNKFPGNQMYESPMVGFASLSEMKERGNQLKQNNYPDYENYSPLIEQDGPNFNNYEQIYKESVEQKVDCNPANTLKSVEDDLKLKLKKPVVKPLEKLSSKLLTAKSLRLPSPILKSPKPILKSASLRANQRDPCT